MSNYTKTTDFLIKDSLASGNPSKAVLGAEVDVEFNNLAIASATKADTGGTGIDVTGTTVSIDFLGLQDLVDPNADRILFWDDSEGAFDWLIAGTGLTITDKTIDATGGGTGVASAFKTADESRTSDTAYADDSDLVLALDASSTYSVKVFMYPTAGNTAPDIKTRLGYTGAPTDDKFDYRGFDSVGTPVPAFNWGIGNPQIEQLDNNNTAVIIADGIVITNTAGDLSLQWAQSVSNAAATTMQAGSYMTALKLS